MTAGYVLGEYNFLFLHLEENENLTLGPLQFLMKKRYWSDLMS